MNNKPSIYLTLIIALSFLFSFCSRPKEVHNRNEMEKIMYDIYFAEALIDGDYSTFDTPEKKEALIKEVFKKHKTTQARWDTSLSWYSDKVDLYLKMNDSVRSRLQKRYKQLDALANHEMDMERSYSDRNTMTTYIPKYYSFNEINPKNGFRFKLDSAYIKKTLDSIDLSFSFDAIGIPKPFPHILTSQLILEYKDTIIYKSEFLLENKKYSIPIESYIKDDTLRNIIGFVKLQDTLRMYKHIQINNIVIGGDSIPINTDSVSITNDSIQLRFNEMDISDMPEIKE